MSIPDWRDVFADALDLENDSKDTNRRAASANAILAAIAARGYRLHRDHDWKHNPDPILAALDFPKIPMKCGRCGILSGSLRDSASCDGPA
jgi:hypothetical protein